MRWTDEAIATAMRGRGLASLAARRLVRRRAAAQEDRFAPLYKAMREAIAKGDWAESHRQFTVLHRMGGVRPSRPGAREALFNTLSRLARECK